MAYYSGKVPSDDDAFDLSLILATLCSQHPFKDLRCQFQGEYFVVNDISPSDYDIGTLERLFQNSCSFSELFEPSPADTGRCRDFETRNPGAVGAWLHDHFCCLKPPHFPFMFEEIDRRKILNMCIRISLCPGGVIDWKMFRPLEPFPSTYAWYKEAMLAAAAHYKNMMLHFESVLCTPQSLLSRKLSSVLKLLVVHLCGSFLYRHKIILKTEENKLVDQAKQYWTEDSVGVILAYFKQEKKNEPPLLQVPIHVLIPDDEDRLMGLFDKWKESTKYPNTLHFFVFELFGYVINTLNSFWKTECGLTLYREWILNQVGQKGLVETFNLKRIVHVLLISSFVNTEDFYHQLELKRKIKIAKKTQEKYLQQLDELNQQHREKPVESVVPLEPVVPVEPVEPVVPVEPVEPVVPVEPLEPVDEKTVDRNPREVEEEREKMEEMAKMRRRIHDEREEQRLRELAELERKQREERHAQKERERDELRKQRQQLEDEKRRKKEEEKNRAMSAKKKKEEPPKQQPKKQKEEKPAKKAPQRVLPAPKPNPGSYEARPPKITLSDWLPGAAAPAPIPRAAVHLSDIDFPKLPTAKKDFDHSLQVISDVILSKEDTEEKEKAVSFLEPIVVENMDEDHWFFQSEKFRRVSLSSCLGPVDHVREEDAKYREFVSTNLTSYIMGQVCSDDEEAKCRLCSKTFNSQTRFPMAAGHLLQECVVCGECWALYQAAPVDTQCDLCGLAYGQHKWALRKEWISQKHLAVLALPKGQTPR